MPDALPIVLQQIDLDIIPGKTPPIVHVSEYDTGRNIVVNLFRDGYPFGSDSIESYTVKVEGSIGKYGFSENAAWADDAAGVVIVHLTEAMTAIRGRVWTKIKLIKSESMQISTCGFWLDVDRAGVEADTVIGAPGFEEQIQNAVDAWIEQNPPDYGIDATLSISGKAADAKATGDTINGLRSDIAVESTISLVWSNGYIRNADGTIGSDTQNLYSTAFEGDGSPIRIAVADGFRVGKVAEYTGESIGTFVKLALPAFSDANTLETVAGHYYRVQIGKSPVADISPSDISSTTIVLIKSSYTDTTLMVSGKAADAFATGRMLRFCAYDKIICGTLNTDTGGDGFGKDIFYSYRKSARLIKIGSAPVSIKISNPELIGNTAIAVWEYDSDGAFLGRLGSQSLVNGVCVYTPRTNVKFIKVTFGLVTSSNKQFDDAEFSSSEPLTVCKNSYIKNPTYDNSIFSYAVSPNAYTSGQLILPPNYTMTGKPVPLCIYIHGTGGMATWDTQIGAYDNADVTARVRKTFEYFANEGFAVFDCYPWTSKYYSASRRISPFVIQPNILAYREGIKYVLENFNVDAQNIFVSGFSLGGNLSSWFAMQSEIPIRAVAMMAPTTGWASTRFMSYFLESSGRQAIVDYFGLQDDPNASTFVSSEPGIGVSGADTFVSEHLDIFCGMAAAYIGVHGAKYSDLMNWMMNGTKTLPSWMQDLPAIPDVWLSNSSGGTGIPSFVDHPELSRFSPVPIKFWQAFDDANVSAHANYTVCNWLKNGGSRAYWRTMPSGYGGHGSLGTGANAPKTSGTTRLGIEYADIPVAQVEMIDFFVENML